MHCHVLVWSRSHRGHQANPPTLKKLAPNPVAIRSLLSVFFLQVPVCHAADKFSARRWLLRDEAFFGCLNMAEDLQTTVAGLFDLPCGLSYDYEVSCRISA